MTDETRKLLLRAEAIPRGDEDDLVHCLAAALRESDRERDEAKQAKVAAGIKADEALRRCVADLDEARNHAARLRSALVDCVAVVDDVLHENDIRDDEADAAYQAGWSALRSTEAGSWRLWQALERACEAAARVVEPFPGPEWATRHDAIAAALAEVEDARKEADRD